MVNKEATRTYSNNHEKSVCKELGGFKVTNSGAGLFTKGDVIVQDSSLLVECKGSMKEKNSFSIKKEWIEKNKQAAFEDRLDNSCIAFNFEPGGKNYYVIDSKLMAFLVDKLEDEYD